jgi:hypothetical protein
VPIILAILIVVLNKHSLGTSACPIYPMQKKIKILVTFTGSPEPLVFTSIR